MAKWTLLLSLLILFLFSCRNDSEKQYLELLHIESVLQNNAEQAISSLDSIGSKNIHGQKNSALFTLLYNEALDKVGESLINDSLMSAATSYFSQKDSLRYSRSLYCLGLIEQSRGNINSATTNFILAKEVALSHDNFTTAAFASLKIGSILEYMMQRDEAIVNYKQASDLFRKADQISNSLISDIHIGKIYANYGVADSSSFYYKRAKDNFGLISDTSTFDYLNSSNVRDLASGLNRKPLVHHTSKIKFYRSDSLPKLLNTINQNPDLHIISQALEKNENYNKALESYKKYALLNDSIQRDNNKSFVIELINKYNDDILRHKAKELEYKNSKYFFIISILALLAIIIIIIIVIVVIRMRRRKEEFIALMEQFKSQAEELTESKNTLLVKLDKSVEAEGRLIEVIESRLRLLRQLISLSYTYGNSPTNVFISQFNKIVNTNNLRDGAFADLDRAVNLKYFGIVDYLRAEYKQLSDDDINLCCLVCAGFSPQEIAAFYNLGNPRSIFVKKTRLAKKMNLDCDIKQFLDRCIAELSS